MMYLALSCGHVEDADVASYIIGYRGEETNPRKVLHEFIEAFYNFMNKPDEDACGCCKRAAQDKMNRFCPKCGYSLKYVRGQTTSDEVAQQFKKLMHGTNDDNSRFYEEIEFSEESNFFFGFYNFQNDQVPMYFVGGFDNLLRMKDVSRIDDFGKIMIIPSSLTQLPPVEQKELKKAKNES